MDQLTAIVSRAAAAVLKFDAATTPRRTKSDRSPVSAADEAANAIIMSELSHLFPDMPIVSEESTSLESISAALTSCFALVDPLDGTKEYLASRTEYTINVALVAAGAPIVGVISAPALGLVWRGIVGYGAERLRLAPGSDAEEPIERTTLKTRRRQPSEGHVAAISRSHFDRETAALLSALPIEATISCGSSLKFCRIAEGSVDIYPRLAPTHEWDIAAGHAIVVASGGAVVAPDGTALTYGGAGKGFVIPGFIAIGDPERIGSVLASAGT